MSSAAADSFIYDETLEDQMKITPFTKKEMLYALDSNNQSYNGQINFSTETLASSGDWLNYSEAYIVVPFLITLRSSADKNATMRSAFFAGLKNGTYQIIDSISVDINGVNVVSQQSFLSHYVNYKLMTTFSEDDLKKHGATSIFYPDNAAHKFSAVASTNGDGYSNNVILSTTTPSFAGAGTTLDTYNVGLAERMKYTSYSIPGGGNNILPAGVGAVPTGLNGTNLDQTFKSYCTDNNLATAGLILQWTICATIPLKFLADFFDKICLTKGTLMNIVINYNAGNVVVARAGAATLSISSVVLTSGNSLPFMLSSGAANNPWAAPLAATDSNYTISSGVVNCNNRIKTPPLTSCRLYVPSYTLNPQYELQLLNQRPMREIRYTDIYSYRQTNISVNSNFNFILNSGIADPKYVIVIPYANTSAGVFVAATVPTYQSPFDSAPGTTLPRAAITQFNVNVSGKNCFATSAQYDFSNFIDELSRTGINGGLSTSLSSGLIGHYEFDNCFRYYVADVGRRLPADSFGEQQIIVSGVNSCGVSIDLLCFVVYGKKINLNMETGRPSS